MAPTLTHGGAGATPLLHRSEPAPFEIVNEAGTSAFLLVCDHAGRRVPDALGDMGVGVADWGRHIALDIGARALTLALSARLDAAAAMQPYSRLVIDCNRQPARADAMPEVSDGTRVPANEGLSAEDRAARVAAVHEPYHAAVDALLDRRGSRATQLVFVHSFTPVMAGFARPWRFGVLHTGQPLALAVLAALRGAGVDPVGDNEPYAMDAVDYSAVRHGTARGLDFVEVEVRQDFIGDAAGVERVANLLAPLLLQAALSLTL